MDIKLLFVGLTFVIGTASFFPYIRDVYRLKTKPHIYTWLIFTLISLAVAIISFFHGGGLGTLGILYGTALNAVVTVLALRYGTHNITRSDTALMLSALAALCVWLFLRDPLVTIMLITAIRAVSYIPTIRKSYGHPWDETLISWIGFTIGNICTIASFTSYNLLTLTNIVTISILNIVVVIECLLRRRVVPNPRKAH